MKIKEKQLSQINENSLFHFIKADSFEDVVASIALFRPGPMNNIDSYIKRKMELHTLQSVKEEQLLYFNKYKVKYNFTQKDIDVIYEIVSFVYKRNSKY